MLILFLHSLHGFLTLGNQVSSLDKSFLMARHITLKTAYGTLNVSKSAFQCCNLGLTLLNHTLGCCDFTSLGVESVMIFSHGALDFLYTAVYLHQVLVSCQDLAFELCSLNLSLFKHILGNAHLSSLFSDNTSDSGYGVLYFG